VPGEGAVFAAALKRAARFGAMSLPILWSISKQGTAQDASKTERLRVHARRVIWEIFRTSEKKEEFKKLLTDPSLREFLARYEKP
jgi:hypothetical protein